MDNILILILVSFAEALWFTIVGIVCYNKGCKDTKNQYQLLKDIEKYNSLSKCMEDIEKRNIKK